MAVISKTVNFDILEKLPDGTYKKKHPETKASQVIAEDGSNLESHLAEIVSQEVGKGADIIGLPDPNNLFTATNVGGAMNELFTNVSSGKSLVGGAITGVDDSVVIPTDPTFGDLASAIGSISTGKKWASGTTKSVNAKLDITGLEFTPSVIIIKGLNYDSSSYGNAGDIGMYLNKDVLGLGYNIAFTTGNSGGIYGINNFTIINNNVNITALVSVSANYVWIAFE